MIVRAFIIAAVTFLASGVVLEDVSTRTDPFLSASGEAGRPAE